MPYTNTPFSQAVFRMFNNLASNLGDTLPDNSSEITLIKAYLFGGCAVHFHTGPRVTNDVDARLERVRSFPNQTITISPVYFKDENGLRKTLIFDRNFDISLATLDPAYEDRALLLYTTESNLVEIYLVSAVDIAVSKLGRFGENDKKDIENLYKNNLFSIREFLELAYEAHSYCAITPDKLIFNIEEATEAVYDLLEYQTRHYVHSE
ncbi:MAG: DUF6036 family nucleotidyltransferase [Cyanobacteria bacterium J06621_8]